MNTIDMIGKLLVAQNKSQKDLCEYLGVGKSVFTNWKNGENNSYKKYYKEIAKFFNVSAVVLMFPEDYADIDPSDLLIRKEVNEDGTVNVKMSLERKTIYLKYLLLSEENQRMINKLIDFLSTNSKGE